MLALVPVTLLLAAPPLPLAAQSKILLQVRDLEEHPIREIRLTYGGVRSLPTNAEGATELNLPHNHPPGVPIKLFLVPNPRKDWFLTGPTINIPAEGFPAELIVMSRSVFRRLAAEVREAQKPSHSLLTGPAGKQEGPTLEQLAARYRLKPEQFDEAIRSFGDTKSRQDQGIAAYLAGQFAQAEGLFRVASGRAERSFVEAQKYLLATLLAQGKYSETEKELRRAVALDPDNAELLSELGMIVAISVLRNSIEATLEQIKVPSLAQRKFGPADDQTVWALFDQADTFERSGRREKAEPLRWRILKTAEASHGLDHPNVAFALSALAPHFEARACPHEALALYRRALRISETHFDASNYTVQASLETTADLLYRLGRPAEALDLLHRAIPSTEWRMADHHPFLVAQRTFMIPSFQILKAEVLFELARFDEAEALMRSVLSSLEQHLGPNHLLVAEVQIRLAEFLQATNRLGEAEALIRRALAINKAWTHPNDLDIARDLVHLGGILLATGCPREAEASLKGALEIYSTLSRKSGRWTPGTTTALERYGHLLGKLGRSEASIQASLAELRQSLPPASPAPLCTPPPPD
jgi:tetratricopeptide (TPR) repeat protein